MIFLRYFFLLLCINIYAQHGTKPKNIIIFIGDGMGANYVSAAVLGLKDSPYKRFTSVGFSITCSADNLITDSAAGATAIATGFRTNNYLLSVDPANNPLKTILEEAEEKGLSTGICVTSSVTHATPAAFYAHILHRGEEFQIAEQLTRTDLDVIIGGGLQYFLPKNLGGERTDDLNLIERMKNRGYSYVTSPEEISSADTTKLIGILDKVGLPPADERDYQLSSLVKAAVKNLSKDKDGFVLMVEGSQIDWAAHNNEDCNIMDELKDFIGAVNYALDFSEQNPNTLVIVTADHETGGMSINGGSINNPDLDLEFTSEGHTAEMVGIFAKGPGEELFRGVMDNSQIGKNLFKLLE